MDIKKFFLNNKNNRKQTNNNIYLKNSKKGKYEMFNLILNNLIESVRKEGVGCKYDILTSPISDSSIGCTASISIDSSGMIYVMEFYREHFNEDGDLIENSKEHISNENFIEMLKESSYVEITVA